MKFSFKISQPKLRVFSAICSNFAVFWLGAMLATKSIFILTFDLIFAIVSLDLAIRFETLLEEK